MCDITTQVPENRYKIDVDGKVSLSNYNLVLMALSFNNSTSLKVYFHLLIRE
jgi:hypothetical protein